MRPALRFLVPLLLVLGGLAWAAAAWMNATTRGWFERDLEMRSRLAASGAREGLVRDWRSGDRRRIGRVLQELAREDRVMAAAACGADLSLVARTAAFPPVFGCGTVGPQLRVEGAGGGPAGWRSWNTVGEVEGGRVHLSAIPVEDEGETLGFLVLLHDMSFVDRREAATRRFTVIAFAVVALAASVVTVLVARFSWRRWTSEMQRLLRGPGEARRRLLGDGAARRRDAFHPLLADMRDLVDDLVAEQSAGSGGGWSAERLRHVLNRHLHGESVIIIANREPYIHERAGDGSIRVVHPASGLVTALEPVMRACSGVWVAHGSGSADRETVDRHGRVRVPPGEESYAIRRVWLSKEEERGYYYGFANEGLWPLCHVAHTRPTFRAEDFAHYRAVNERFAEAACAEAEGPDPIILVQDYHFALAPQMIRRRLPRATILAFWHIPWPNAERVGICPYYAELLEGLLGSSIVGFHTRQHCNNFLEAADRHLEARIDREEQAVVVAGRPTLVRDYPISIEWPSHWAAGLPPAEECARAVRAELGLRPDALLGVGIDRLDYTKGIEERLLAVERLLEQHPRFRGRFSFAQLAAPSRTALESYQRLNDTVEALVARINARFGAGSYRPIVLLRRHHEPPEVFRAYRAADLCYVSSLHDGMNLVAKEFVSARDDDQGVLVLSRFTGAARELTEALLVNPYDLEQAAAALATALDMPRTEQQERMRAMRALVSERNVYRWAGRMLADAARLRKRDRVSGRLLETTQLAIRTGS
jgi:trehalose 6-phosphate synthase